MLANRSARLAVRYASCLACLLVLTLLLLADTSLAIQSEASLSGVVRDATGGRLTGVVVTATHDATAIDSNTTSNAAGFYTFPNLRPGIYTLTASVPGFQALTYTDVRLLTASDHRLNLDMVIVVETTEVDVVASAEGIPIESGASVGTVLNEDEIIVLPLLSNDALDLVHVMGGFTIPEDRNPFQEVLESSFGGVIDTNNVNVVRDGVTAVNQRWPTGIEGTTTINSDLVAEMKIVVTPVDAEVGRGNGQIQVRTRSGTNELHGGLVWNIQNSALDANSWFNNSRPTRITPDWRNLYEYSVRLGGPVRRNRTFFFVLWDQVIGRTRTVENPVVLTPCARRGMFRYFDHWNNGNALSETVIGSNPVTAVVDAAGTPLAPALNPDGSPHNGILRFENVFGHLQNSPVTPDCGDAILGAAPTPTGTWDVDRVQTDPTGFVGTLLDFMPLPNNWDVGDGLNTAGHRWTRRPDGNDNELGLGRTAQRQQINLRIDHHFSQNHWIGGSWSYQQDFSGTGSVMIWPGTFQGQSERRPQVLSVNLNSVLSANRVNEIRFGMTRNGVHLDDPIDYPGTAATLKMLLPEANDLTVVPLLGVGSTDPHHVLGTSFDSSPTTRDDSPRYTIADSLSWVIGPHALRLGGEWRHGRSASQVSGTGANENDTRPRAVGGRITLGLFDGPFPFSSGNWPGTLGQANQALADGLLTFLAGSLAGIEQGRFISEATDAQLIRNRPLRRAGHPSERGERVRQGRVEGNRSPDP